MNHAIFVIKVCKNPVHSVHCEQKIIEIEVQFPTPRQKNYKNKFKLILWGNHKDDFLKYYKIQDYLLVEGIITINTDNDIKITVKRIYPFFFKEKY